jgi:hypothetical protein
VYVDLACPNDSGQKLRRGGLLFFFTSLFSFSLHDLIQARALFWLWACRWAMHSSTHEDRRRQLQRDFYCILYRCTRRREDGTLFKARENRRRG